MVHIYRKNKPTGVRRIDCSGCGVGLEYTLDERERWVGTDYGGIITSRHWIICPGCGSKVRVG